MATRSTGHDLMTDDPYKPPKVATRSAQTLGQIAWSQQSVFGAFFGGSLGAFIGVALWKIVVILTADNSPLLALLVAVCVGFFVRFNGRGLTIGYCAIAAFFAWVGVIAGLLFTGLSIYVFRTIFVCVGVGVIAALLARRSLDAETRKSVWRLRHGILQDTE